LLWCCCCCYWRAPRPLPWSSRPCLTTSPWACLDWIINIFLFNLFVFFRNRFLSVRKNMYSKSNKIFQDWSNQNGSKYKPNFCGKKKFNINALAFRSNFNIYLPVIRQMILFFDMISRTSKHRDLTSRRLLVCAKKLVSFTKCILLK
jgi:hypothetical protein